MLSRLAWLALEVKYLEEARSFYEGTLSMTVRSAAADELTLAAGGTDLVLRRPAGVPRGGLHTHYAFSIPADEYGEWWDRLERAYDGDLEEVQFGSAKSLYLYDPDGNCVELGQQDVEGPGIDGVFEVVLEVENLERAEAMWREVGFETVDRGERRTRVRMNGPMALELWEPQLGIADARGGVHVDLGFETSDPLAVADALRDRALSVDDADEDRVVVRDPDGHHLTFVPSPSAADDSA
ncbi:VOC family protein [Natrialbaceae archaeon GCM10025810]|uniref:VOC family protein n=1 Tax=Halovalidus salilacus TaxID=3075124 RepID=UPI00360789FA